MLIAPLVAAGCVSVPADDPGQIIAFNGNTVTIRGGIPAGFAATAAPSAGMVSTAQSVCSGARYANSAEPVPITNGRVEFDYLFIC